MAVGKNGEAVVELKRAVISLPKEPLARLQLARAYEASDDLPATVQEYQKLVELAPQEAEYSYQLGRALSKLSERSYQHIVRLDSNAARLHQSLGQEVFSSGKI
ncbi:MAG: hypothetical protein WKF84_15190 [Pyrinomonadaceae bacterium]